MQPIICFISDFGLDDTWVGVCHAVIFRACPDARVVDLAHHIPAFDIRRAAEVAAAGVYQLPDAIHLIVVDPGVGGSRRDLCIETSAGTKLVGPDNGVLMPAATRAGGVALAYALPATDPLGRQALGTFHARDVLAPAAAALACGKSPESLGEPLDPSTLAPAPFAPARVEGDYVLAEVLAHDRFGSLRISATADDVAMLDPASATLELAIGHIVIIVPYGRTFSDVASGELVALIDSSGWLTLAQNGGSAFERLGVEPGTHVRIRARA